MVNQFKLKQAKIQRGADKTSDIAILEFQLRMALLWLQPARSNLARIKKFIDINDALDGLESLIAGKIRLGDKTWLAREDVLMRQLKDPSLAYNNPEKFRWLVKQRYTLYNIVLQSLGYYTNEIIRDEAYVAAGYDDMGNKVYDYE